MNQIHILVVDDNHINRLYLKTILTQWHHHVTAVDSGADALSACRQQEFDLILMDIRMQPMDGVTAAANIKKLSTYKQTPIIAVSAETFQYTDHSQFDGSLIKPINKDALQQLITEVSNQTNKKQKTLFDESKALSISHEDSKIVRRLRTLFIEELPSEIIAIEHLHQSASWLELDNQLHHLLGSTRVCAAVTLAEKIDNYRQHLAAGCFDQLDVYLTELTDAAQDILDYDAQSR
ncbi:response regulator [Marinicella gelatinilytica]|uniref:response regulator n=1 Tax=Marinicella gelatinilytica TaxID=2996017 RepID=UPI002260A586|nr:response regulator [Marinicella gelatinilytica]MCX7544782.1 response regulator [Marinicella gelatinilytica]